MNGQQLRLKKSKRYIAGIIITAFNSLGVLVAITDGQFDVMLFFASFVLCGVALILWGKELQKIRAGLMQPEKKFKIWQGLFIGAGALFILSFILMGINPDNQKNTTVTATESITERISERITEKTTVKPTEKPTPKPTPKSTEKPTEKPTPKPTEKPTEKPTPKPTEKPTEKAKIKSLLFGELLSVTEQPGNNKYVVIKAKITQSSTNTLTINQNYYSIADVIKNQGGNKYETIDYWAVANMTGDGDTKVISFTLDSATIQKIYNGDIFENKIGEYAQDLWIYPSLTTSETKTSNNTQTYNNIDQQNTSEYVLNTNTKKVHRPGCSDVKRIAPENYATTSDLNQAIADGYSPCKRCNP